MPNPFLLTDFYKISHPDQYPEGTEVVYSTGIPRESRIEGIDHVVMFGLQGFVKEYLIDYFNENFFNRPKDEVLAEYSRIIKFTLGVEEPDTSRIGYLHDLGYLPLEIKAVPEGSRVPLRVPMFTIENTDPKCFWLTNSLETLMSCEIWQSFTSATIAAEYRRILDHWCSVTGGDPSLVQFQGHDFSMRGMVKIGGAAASGAGHLLSFTGTDTIPAILYLEKFYGADVEKELVGTSIPATEHTVMCTGIGVEGELETYRRIIRDVYPSGFVSIVSDTLDLWKVMDEIVPALHDDIMSRDGRVVIRPDSGDPADIICGTHPYLGGATSEQKGVYELLWDQFGGTVNAKGYLVLDPHVGCIYGDSITLDRANDIMRRLAAKGFCVTSQVLGVGSYTYQYQTRDTFGFKLGATYVEVNGEGINIFKDPATDKAKVKKSLTGRVSVYRQVGELYVIDGLTREKQDSYERYDILETVFYNGELKRDETLAEIRARVAS